MLCHIAKRIGFRRIKRRRRELYRYVWVFGERGGLLDPLGQFSFLDDISGHAEMVGGHRQLRMRRHDDGSLDSGFVHHRHSCSTENGSGSSATRFGSHGRSGVFAFHKRT